MNSKFQTLRLFQSETHAALHGTEARAMLHARTPAITVFEDFRLHRPPAFSANLTVPEARQQLGFGSGQIRLVSNSGGDYVGLITAAELNDERAMALAGRRGVPLRDVSVAEIMHRIGELPTIGHDDLLGARLADLVDVFNCTHQPCLLVMESDADTLRGLVPASLVARGLQVELDLQPRPQSFGDMVRVVQGW